MHAIGLVMLALLSASERSPSFSTTLPGGTQEVSGALGPKDIGSLAGPGFGWDAEAAVTLALGDAVSVHLALAATNTTDVLADFYRTAPRLGAGSVQRLGFRRLPLVQVRVLPMLSADLFADAWADFPYQGPIAFEALAGATFEFPW